MSAWTQVWTTVHVLWLMLFAGMVIAPSFFMYPGTDWGAYVNVGRLLAEGSLPYQDVWEFKPPVIFLYLACWCQTFGTSWWSVNAALIPIYGGFGLAVYGFYRVLFARAWSACFAGSLAILLVGRLSVDAARNGAIVVLASAFELSALMLFWLAWQSRHTKASQQVYRYAFLSGVLAATAILTRQTSIVALAVPILWWLFERTPTVAKMVASFLAGGTTVGLLLGLVAMFAGLDILQAIQGSIEFSRVYLADIDDTYGKVAVLANFGKHQWSCWLLAAAALAYSLRYPRGSKLLRQRAVLFVVIPLVLAIVIKVFVGKKLINYYYFPLFGYLAIVVVFMTCLLFQYAIRGKRWAWVVCSVMLATLSYNVYQDVEAEKKAIRKWQASVRSHQGVNGFGRKRWSWSRHLRGFDKSTMADMVVAKSVSDLFQRQQSEDRTLFTYGNRSWIHVFSNATSTTRHCHVVGFLGSWSAAYPQRASEIIDEFRQTPPQVIVQWFSMRQVTRKGKHRSQVNRPQFNGLAAEFDKKVLSKYELIEEFTFSNAETYPYKPQTAHVYQLRESEPVRLARKPE